MLLLWVHSSLINSFLSFPGYRKTNPSILQLENKPPTLGMSFKVQLIQYMSFYRAFPDDTKTGGCFLCYTHNTVLCTYSYYNMHQPGYLCIFSYTGLRSKGQRPSYSCLYPLNAKQATRHKVTTGMFAEWIPFSNGWFHISFVSRSPKALS